MADNYQKYYERERLNQNASRVYINPNFRRIDNNLPPPHSSMYVNPNFPQFLPNPPPRPGNSRIYVNPNFIKANSITASNNSSSVNVNRTILDSNLKDEQNCIQTVAIKTPTILPLPDQKSRYRVVRNKDENKPIDVQPNNNVNKVTTFKVNRYKSVPLLDVKKNLETVKPVQKLPTELLIQPQKQRPKKLSNSPKIQQSRFKFVKRNIESVPHSSSNLGKPSPIRKSLITKNLLRSNLKVKIKINRRLLKKNNIPCPLFKKYGKCLRNIQGHCEFLHDKKHVSICRRFLKGTCHDKECLLSHDLTVQKMPTCSFYLKGMCTKEGCPYLHVKLNEKTKICTDFLKGFCEKGDKCLNRHINPDIRKRNEKGNKMKKVRNTSNFNQSLKSTQTKTFFKPKTNDTSTQEQEVKDCRYYKETNEANTSTEYDTVIKPTRCKLGTLPSFIQL